MKLRWLIPLVTAVFLYSLIVHAPAAILYAWFAPKDSPIQLNGISGELEHGQIASLQLHGQILAKNLEWKLRPLRLLLGQISVQIHASGEEMNVDGSARTGLGGAGIDNFHVSGLLKPLLAVAGYQFVPAQGGTELQIDRLNWSAGWISALRGQIKIHHLNWAMGSQPLTLGDFTADLSTDKQGAAVAKLSSLNGPIDLSGTASLASDGKYQLDLKLHPNPGAPQSLVTMLKTLGRQNVQGDYRLRDQGRMNLPIGRK